MTNVIVEVHPMPDDNDTLPELKTENALRMFECDMNSDFNLDRVLDADLDFWDTCCWCDGEHVYHVQPDYEKKIHDVATDLDIAAIAAYDYDTAYEIMSVAVSRSIMVTSGERDVFIAVFDTDNTAVKVDEINRTIEAVQVW